MTVADTKPAPSLETTYAENRPAGPLNVAVKGKWGVGARGGGAGSAPLPLPPDGGPHHRGPAPAPPVPPLFSESPPSPSTGNRAGGKDKPRQPPGGAAPGGGRGPPIEGNSSL